MATTRGSGFPMAACTGPPVPSKSLGWGFFELHHQTWECQDDGWKVWEAPDTTMEAEAHRQLACSAYASPSKVYSVRGHEKDVWCHSPYGQSEICNLSLRKGGRRCGSHQVSRVSRRICLPMPARVVGEVASDLEQKKERHSGGCGKYFTRPCRIKKAPERGRHQGDAQMDAHVQCTVLAEISATRPSPDSPQSV
jgi:hypothetical protein